MVADSLRHNGVQVRFSSYGEAAGYVSMRGFQCVTVPPIEFAWNTEGGFSVKQSIANIPIWFTNLSRQVNHEIKNMAAFGPDVVLSDSRLSPLVAAKLLRIPSIVLLNQVKLLLSPRLRQLAVARLFERMVGEVLGSMWNLADRVLVPDLPPPYTISAHNVWGVGSIAGKLEYIGFMAPRPHVQEEQVRKVAGRLGITRSMPVVFVHISGPMATRMPMIRLALEAAKKLDGRMQLIFSEGRPNGSPEPRRVGQNGWYYEWCPVRDEVFMLSDLVVMRGGHVALSQAIQFGKPIVTIPIENHGEQLGNSEKIESLGLGVMVHPKNLKPDQIAQAIEQVLGGSSYQSRVAKLVEVTARLNGIENVAKIVQSYVR
jgi:UDP:flavonoid glycosyltransferase YjiC (YdhE family)